MMYVSFAVGMVIGTTIGVGHYSPHPLDRLRLASGTPVHPNSHTLGISACQCHPSATQHLHLLLSATSTPCWHCHSPFQGTVLMEAFSSELPWDRLQWLCQGHWTPQHPGDVLQSPAQTAPLGCTGCTEPMVGAGHAGEETLSRLTPRVHLTLTFKLRPEASAEPEQRFFYLNEVPKEFQRERSCHPTPSTAARGPAALLGGSILLRKWEMLLGFFLCSLSESGTFYFFFWLNKAAHECKSSWWFLWKVCLIYARDLVASWYLYLHQDFFHSRAIYCHTPETRGAEERSYKHSHPRCKNYGFQTSINKWECECWEHKIAQLWVSAEALLFTEHLCVYEYSALDRAKSWFWY